MFRTLSSSAALSLLLATSANAQTPFGSSCAGASGVTPTLGVSGTVATGQQWFLDVTAPGGIGLGYLLVGFSNTNASILGGMPLPLDLGTLFSDPLWSVCPLNVDANYLISTYFFSPGVNGGLAQIQFPGFNSGSVFMQVLNIDPDFITRIAGVSQGIQIFPTPPSPPQPGDLVITEIMKDPVAVSDTLGEWFEVLNTTNAAIDIEGWTLRDDSSDTMVLANGGSGIVVPANAYFVIGRNANFATNGGVGVNFKWNGSMSLGNASDEIVLVEPSGPTEIARVDYDGGMTFPDSAGISMELDVAFLNEVDNDNGANWDNSTCFLPNSSTDKGTPGIANDLCISIPPGMVAIQPGVFQMGSNAPGGAPYFDGQNDNLVHTVTISNPFWIGQHEVTQAEYTALMGSNPSEYVGQNRPVETVSWSTARDYCTALTVQETLAGNVPVGFEYRLPTEAEWEYACRAGTTTEFNVGAALLCSDAWIGGTYHPTSSFTSCGNPSGTVDVGGYAPNLWGLYDMHGNVREWCLDTFANYSGASMVDPFVSGAGGVVRGGASGDSSNNCRSAFRINGAPNDASSRVGFRVVLAPVLVP